MQIRLLTTLADLEQIWDDWAALYQAANQHGSISQSPFHNPDLHRVWWQHLGFKEGWSPLVAIGTHNGKLVAVASLAIRRAGLVRVLEWAGIAAFDYPGILMAPEADVEALWKAIRRRGGFDVARLRSIRTDAAYYPQLSGFASKIGLGQQARAIELEHPDGQAWLAAMPKGMRTEHRQKLRMLEKRGPVTLRLATTADEIRATVKSVVDFKAEWSRSRGVDTVYRSPGITEYFQDLALAAARDQTLHLSTLEVGGVALAAHLGFICKDGFYYYVPAYDPAAAKQSPGQVHMNMLVMWAVDHGLTRFDFLRGEADHKNRLGTTVRQLDDLIFPRGLIGSVAQQTIFWRQRHRAPVQPDGGAPVAPSTSNHLEPVNA